MLLLLLLLLLVVSKTTQKGKTLARRPLMKVRVECSSYEREWLRIPQSTTLGLQSYQVIKQFFIVRLQPVGSRSIDRKHFT